MAIADTLVTWAKNWFGATYTPDDKNPKLEKQNFPPGLTGAWNVGATGDANERWFTNEKSAFFSSPDDHDQNHQGNLSDFTDEFKSNGAAPPGATGTRHPGYH